MAASTRLTSNTAAPSCGRCHEELGPDLALLCMAQRITIQQDRTSKDHTGSSLSSSNVSAVRCRPSEITGRACYVGSLRGLLKSAKTLDNQRSREPNFCERRGVVYRAA